MELSTAQDTDLRFAEGSKKRSLSCEPNDSEPTNKKNRAETDLYEMTFFDTFMMMVMKLI